MNDLSQRTTDNRRQTLFTMLRKFLNRGSWIIVLIFIISSCSVKKETSSLKMLSANHIVKEVEDNKFEFDSFEAKFDVKIENDMDLKGQLRMQNDSVIWVSLSLKLGVEVARAMITEDSIKVIMRTGKTYFTTSTKNLDTIVPIEKPLQWIQNILVGNDIQIEEGKYNVSIENDRYKLETKEKNNQEQQLIKEIFVTPKTYKISRYEIKELSNQNYEGIEVLHSSTLGLNYNNFQNINDKLIPSKIIYEDNALTIEINYSDIKIGEKLEFPFNISKKYKKINL